MQQQQQRMQFLSLQKPLQASNQKVQQRQGPSAQLSGSQAQNSAVSMNIKTDQILNQLQNLACTTQAQTENTEKLKQRLQKSEEGLEVQKKQNQVLRMENGKIIEQLRLSKCSMEQLEVQVQSLVSNVEEQKTSTRETQKKLLLAESKYEQSRAWREALEQRLEKTKMDIQDLCDGHAKEISELKSEIDSKDNQIEEKIAKLEEAGAENEKLNIELAAVKLSFDKKEGDIVKLQAIINDLEMQSKNLRDQVEQARNDAKETQVRNELLENEKRNLSSEVLRLINEANEMTKSFDRNLQQEKQLFEEKLLAVQATYNDQERIYREEIELLQAKLKDCGQVTAKLALEAEDQTRIILEKTEQLTNQQNIIEDSHSLTCNLQAQLVEAVAKTSQLQVLLTSTEEENSLLISGVCQLESLLDKNVQDLETSSQGITLCINNLLSNDQSSRLRLEKLVAAQELERHESQQKLDEMILKASGLAEKNSFMERQVREAEHKADERIKLNLFEAQKHLNLQIVAMREEHNSAVAILQSQSQALREQLAASESENVQLRDAANRLREAEENNDKLRTELLQESCKVEQLSRDLDEQSLQLASLEKQNQILKQSSYGTTAAEDAADVRKALFVSVKETSSQNSSQKAPFSTSQNSGQKALSSMVGCSTQGFGKGDDLEALLPELEHDSGSTMKKRALGPSSKGKSGNKRASKKQSVLVFEPPTLKKSSHPPHGKGQDRSSDDSCKEFDLFGA